MHHIFVYGTLKEGFPNFDLNKGQRIPGNYVTKVRYPLYIVGDRHSPWLVSQPNVGTQVKGQVFVVDDLAILEMDRLERISEPDGYKRMKIQILNLETLNELTVFAHMKLKKHLVSQEIKLGPLSSYELEHSKLYRSRNP